jgi:integrase
VFKAMTGDSSAFTQAKEIAMFDSTDVQNSIDRMKIHMELRGHRPMTVSTFNGYARRFLAHVGKAPEAVTAADVESFVLDLCRKGRAARTRNVALAAVRCLLFATTGNDATVGIPRAKVPRLSPEILSGSEVARLLAATDSPKYRAIFMLAYGAGLRVGEIAALKVMDIDSERMLIHVREGKTGARHVMLSPRVLEALRTYWKAARPAGAPSCFLVAARNARERSSRAKASTKLSSRSRARPESRSAYTRTCCAIASPPTCSKLAPTSAACRSCWDLPAFNPPPPICT